MLKTITKRKLFNLAQNFARLKSDLPPNYPLNIGDMKVFQRTRYDGRSKKRQWEERRSDKGEGLVDNPKKIKKSDEAIEKSEDKVKRRKFCLLMGYSGADYFGMQRNPNTKTIEEDLFQALLKAELINEECFHQVQNMQFQRAARTDKGVSAARQIVSLKLPENIDLTKINQQLPEVIRVFAYKRVTKGFNSKSQCDGRTYIYLLPTVSFAEQNENISQKDYRMKDETFTKINEILQNYVGTKNFHNYTSKKKPNDPSANRYITSFICEKPFLRNDVEFVVLKVRGQSFMMHQIRKMVGFLLAIIRGLAPTDLLNSSLTMDKVCVPKAPGLGLVLEYVHYERYNNRYGTDGMHDKLTWEDVEEEVNAFKEKYIYPTIIDTEIRDEQMVSWLRERLSKHSYDFEEEDESDNDNDGDDEPGEKSDETKELSNDKVANIST